LDPKAWDVSSELRRGDEVAFEDKEFGVVDEQVGSQVHIKRERA